MIFARVYTMVRPQHITSPYPKGHSEVVIHDRVWHVPSILRQGIALTGCESPFVLPEKPSFSFLGWSDERLFGNTNPVCIEFCSGNGDWIVHKALAFPEINWLAVEKRFDRVRKIWSKVKNNRCSNLVIAYGEGLHISSSYLPEGSVHHLFVNFPDPWPKHRHAKHRIISCRFFDEVARVLVGKGTCTFVTDDEPYSQLFSRIQTNAFQSLLPEPGYTSLPSDYGSSFFSELFVSQKKQIYYHKIQKIGAAHVNTGDFLTHHSKGMSTNFYDEKG